MQVRLQDQLEGLFSGSQDLRVEKRPVAPVSSARESTERYQRLVEDLPVGVYRVMPGLQGKFLVANRAFRNLFSIDSEMLERITLADLVVNPAEHIAFFNRLVADGKIASGILSFRKLDGTPVLGLVTAKATHTSGHAAAYFDCVIVDVP